MSEQEMDHKFVSLTDNNNLRLSSKFQTKIILQSKVIATWKCTDFNQMPVSRAESSGCFLVEKLS